MELEDLVLKKYSVKRTENKIVVFEDELGHYKAPSSDALERALNELVTIKRSRLLFWRSRIGGRWYPVSRP